MIYHDASWYIRIYNDISWCIMTYHDILLLKLKKHHQSIQWRHLMITRFLIAFEDLLASSLAPQVMPPCFSLFSFVCLSSHPSLSHSFSLLFTPFSFPIFLFSSCVCCAFCSRRNSLFRATWENLSARAIWKMNKGLRYITISAISIAIYIARKVLIAARKGQEIQVYNMSREHGELIPSVKR